MPELPEVETTVRGLARYLEGERIARVTLNRPDLRRPFPQDLVQALTGARVTALARRAKYGLIHTDRGQTMIFHLGMSGRWRIEPERAEKPASDALDDLLRAKTRKREIVQARQISMFFAKELTKASLKTIGMHFGGRDHSTVIHAVQTVNDLISIDKEFRKNIDDIKKKISMSLT